MVRSCEQVVLGRFLPVRSVGGSRERPHPLLDTRIDDVKASWRLSSPRIASRPAATARSRPIATELRLTHPLRWTEKVRNLAKGWPHDLHVVLCHKILVRFGIDTLPFRKHHLEPAGRHTKQQHTGFCPNVLERVWGHARNINKGPGGRAHNTFAQFEVELTAYNVAELSFHNVQVRRRAALRRDGLTKDAEHAPSLLSCRQQLSSIGLSALWAAVTGCFAG